MVQAGDSRGTEAETSFYTRHRGQAYQPLPQGTVHLRGLCRPSQRCGTTSPIDSLLLKALNRTFPSAQRLPTNWSTFDAKAYQDAIATPTPKHYTPAPLDRGIALAGASVRTDKADYIIVNGFPTLILI